MTRQSILDEIRKKNEVHSIRIKGNKKDKEDGFYIMMNTQQLFSDSLDIYHGIKNETLELLKRAEINFEIIKQDDELPEIIEGVKIHKIPKPIDEIDKELEEELDKQFPKGDKSRGKALVLFAMANIKINKLKKKK